MSIPDALPSLRCPSDRVVGNRVGLPCLLRRHRAHPRWSAESFSSLAALLECGLPVDDALLTLARSADARPPVRRAALDLRERILDGERLSDAMESIPGCFDAVECAIVSSGERSGEVHRALVRAAARRDRGAGHRSRMITALTYPAIVLIAGLLVTAYLSIHTLPQLASLLESFDVGVPRLTRAMIVFGQLAWSWWPVPCGMLMALALVGRLRPDGLMALMPMTRMQRRTLIARWSADLSTLLAGGVALLPALRIIASSRTHPSLRRDTHLVACALEEGLRPGEALAGLRWFDIEFRRLIDHAFVIGELDGMLARIAQRYEQQSERRLRELTALIEPAAIIALSLVIGVVVIAALQPLVRLQEFAQ